MLDTYGAANYEEEDEDDDEDEEYLAECRRIEELERQRAEQERQRAEIERQRLEQARLASQQAEAELVARKAALLAQQEAEEEFQRKKQKSKYNNSYLTDADLSGDVGELLNKVRNGMGVGDFDPDLIDPEKANFSAIINTSDYKRFKDITMSEIQVMTNDDLERLAEYTAKQEFFYLTALAVKMTHELSYSAAFQVVTNQELWRRAIEQNIPFHRFYGFITNEITKSYLEQSAIDKQSAKDGVNLRSHRELMIANIKERQKQKGKRD
jgi:multidrug efflux pump subunit AcrA (membrane-fusion protein)